MSRLLTKMTHPSKLTMHLVLRKGRLLRFRLFQINPNLLDGETFMGLTTSLTGGLTVSLTTSLTEGSEEDEKTKCVEWGAYTEMFSTKPIPDLSKGDF